MLKCNSPITRRVGLPIALIVAMFAALALVGCSDSPSSESDPTTRALSDPMNYSPNQDDSVSGGGLTDFDKDAFKKDMDHVLNP